MANLTKDLRRVRGALGWLTVLGSLAIGLYLASTYFKNEMRKEYQSGHARFRAISQRYLSVDEEERIIREEYPRFVALYEAGIIGAERRLDWLEGVRITRERLGLPHMNLRMESQRPAEPGFPVAAGGFELKSSTMQLTLGLVHEGDLLRFFDALESQTPGLFSVQRCALTRRQAEIVIDAVERNLDASCELSWYTLELSGGRRVAL